MKYLLLIAMMLILPGCTTNLAWRGVIVNYDQKATTEGTITNTPTSGANSVAAEKTTDAKLDVPLTK
jgi:hypothetical protein